ncbi:MAG TPA: hypothetical protein VFW20_10140, partial [Candidatus Limnocylindrales bacterium]|nr:hypothetical protein [Candidatus Limnocylindrales bacterium]
AIKSGASALAETLQRVSTAAYQAAASEAGSNGADGGAGGAGGSGGASGPGNAGDETVEGEYKEV